MYHQEKCDGCGDIFPEDCLVDRGPPSMLVLCPTCLLERQEYELAEDRFNAECEKQDACFHAVTAMMEPDVANCTGLFTCLKCGAKVK